MVTTRAAAGPSTTAGPSTAAGPPAAASAVPAPPPALTIGGVEEASWPWAARAYTYTHVISRNITRLKTTTAVRGPHTRQYTATQLDAYALKPRSIYLEALLAHVSGNMHTGAAACISCARGLGPFVSCVTSAEPTAALLGECTNCHWVLTPQPARSAAATGPADEGQEQQHRQHLQHLLHHQRHQHSQPQWRHRGHHRRPI